MKTKLLFLLCFALLTITKAQDTMKVLFIGNSFTYNYYGQPGAERQDMPGALDSLARYAGKKYIINRQTSGGKYMDYWVTQPSTYVKLHSQKWDYVVLQDNQGAWVNNVGSIPAANIQSNTRMMDSVKSIIPCAKVLWFAGWSGKGGYPQYWPGDNSVKSIQRIMGNFRYFNNMSTIKQIVAPIGDAWITTLNQRPDIELWLGDAIHPATAGTYLGANVIYTTIFKENPHSNGFTDGFDPADAQFLRDAAFNAVYNNMPINNLSAYTPPLTATGSTLNTSTGFTTYQWYLNGAKIIGATSASYVPVGQGPYSVRVTNLQGCLQQSMAEYMNDAAVVSISNPIETVCSSSVVPTVSISNFGLSTLTSASIDYKIDNGSISTYTWSGSLAHLASTAVSLTSLPVTNGTHVLSARVYNPNSIVDINTSNDTQVKYLYVSTTGASVPLFEGFESATFPPTGWRATNADGDVTWARTTAVAATGAGSMYMNNINYPFNGPVDEIYLPNVNLNSISAPTLSFKVAYQLQSDPGQSPNWSDTLAVLISTDCGATYSVVYKKSGTGLVTSSPVFSSTPFFPTPSQWRLETINLSPYGSSANVIIKFKHTTDFENNLFVDNVNIFGVTALDNYDKSQSVTIFPNPSNGELFFSLNDNGNIKSDFTVFVYNSLGELVRNSTLSVNGGNLSSLDLTDSPDGIYFVEVKTENGRFVQKVILK